ncbi:MAG TPA: histidine kinase [Sporichthya sp.]|nr:histidine kinase [Sporichthya sp.]
MGIDRRLAATVAAVGWMVILAAGAGTLFIEPKLRAAGRSDLALQAADAPYVLALFVASGVGTALMVHQPRHPVGWLFHALGVTLALSGVGDDYAAYAVLARPGAWPGGPQVATLSSGVWILWFALVALILQLTPTGRPLSPRWGLLVRASACLGALAYGAFLLRPGHLRQEPFEGLVNPWGVDRLEVPLELITIVGAAATGLTLVAGGFSLIVRFRRAVGDERRQLLWLALVAVPLPLIVGGSFAAASTGHDTVLDLLTVGFILLIPVAAGLSIARYRLYDVDRILTRAATYTLLTVALAGIYVGTVLFAVWSLREVSGRSQIATTLATLATVAAAAPARRWVQQGVDRRFSRRRFEALAMVRAALRGDAVARDLEEVLRAATGDPALCVAYFVAGDDRWVSAAGAPAEPSPDAVELSRHGRPVARISFDPAQVDRSLIESVAEEAATELENVALRAAVALQLSEVRDSRARIVAAQLAERHRIERNLHDGAQQRLLALAFQLRAAQLRAADSEAGRALGHDLDAAVAELQTAVAELRALANGLHPALLTDGGLAAALEDLAARAPVPIRLQVPSDRFSPAVEAAAWFVTCEAVANSVKHARAEMVEIVASRCNGALHVAIRDDGVGGADPSGPGLRGITDRAEAVGGQLRIGPGPDGCGTLVDVELPCGS